MKPFTLWFPVLLALLLSATVAPAQSLPKCDGWLTTSSDGCLAMDYDRFKDTTTVAIRFLLVNRPNDGRNLILMVLATSKGKPVAPLRADLIAVAFVSVRADLTRQIAADRVLYVIADNERLRFDLDLMSSDYRDDLFSEQLTGRISLDLLRRMAAATQLEMRLRSDELTFESKQQANLRLYAQLFSEH